MAKVAAKQVVRSTGETMQDLVQKNKFDATSDPTVNDDNTQGYGVGSRIINVTTDKEFVCLDATTGAAVWTETTAAAGGDSTQCINFVIDGGGITVATGQKGHVVMAFAGEILEVTLLADQSGSIVIDIWKDTYASFPPTVADTITAAAKPTLANQQKYQDATLTGWTKTFAAGDILAFNVDSATTVQRVTLSLKIQRT
jgi:hypothetical protein